MPPTTETELLDATIDLATLCRWAVCHFRPARTKNGYRTAIQGHIGFPDLVLARDGIVLFRELKGPKGRVSSEQRDWGHQIQPGWLEMRANIPDDPMRLRFDVWRPEHWDTIIVPTLRTPRHNTRPPVFAGYPAPNVAPT